MVSLIEEQGKQSLSEHYSINVSQLLVLFCHYHWPRYLIIHEITSFKLFSTLKRLKRTLHFSQVWINVEESTEIFHIWSQITPTKIPRRYVDLLKSTILYKMYFISNFVDIIIVKWIIGALSNNEGTYILLKPSAIRLGSKFKHWRSAHATNDGVPVYPRIKQVPLSIVWNKTVEHFCKVTQTLHRYQ